MPVQSTLNKRTSVGQILSMPPQWLGMYEQFITKNAGQVSQIESALRSLTYIIPGELLDVYEPLKGGDKVAVLTV